MRLAQFFMLPFFTAATGLCYGNLDSQKNDKELAVAIQSLDRSKMTAQESNNCLEALIMKNHFDSANALLAKFYADASEDELSQVRGTARTTIFKVRKEQDELMKMISSKGKAHELSPAFRWAQSLNSTFLQVKFATRFDSPACLDTSNLRVTIGDDSRSLVVQALCGRNDAQNLLYMLKINLQGDVHGFEVDQAGKDAYDQELAEFKEAQESYETALTSHKIELAEWNDLRSKFKADIEKLEEEIKATDAEEEKSEAETQKDQLEGELDDLDEKKPTEPAAPKVPDQPKVSTFEMESVGRVYIMLSKKEDKRWKFIDADVSAKLQNQQLWWDLHEKYQDELGDDEEDVSETTKVPKKKKKKSKKTKKSSKKEDL